MSKGLAVVGLVVVLAWGSLSLAGCGGQPGTVEGTVTRIESGAIVTEGQVAVFALDKVEKSGGLDIYQKGDLLQTVSLDENNPFSISLPAGDYVVEAWVPQVANASQKIRVKSGQVTTVHLQVKTPSE